MKENNIWQELSLNTIYNMDCLEGMKLLADNSVDAIVTDPPYWLSFMGKKRDYDVPSQEIRQEALRVLKPWWYLLSFAGTRTQHRMAVRIEDAGFEIRDMIAWVYGSWFPKSLNIWKSIENKILTGNASKNGFHKLDGERRDGRIGMYDTVEEQGFRKVNPDQLWAFDLEPTTDESKKWNGWGTALKPALESITLAQKSFDFSSVLDILIKDNLYILRKELCQFPLCVWIAEKHLQLNQQEQEGNVSQSIAEWIAEKNINIQEDLPVVIDILQSLLIENTNWNIVLWWLSILVELYNQTNTYITETKISLTTDLIILNSYEFESIYQSIIQAKDNQTNELTASVYNVELLFKGLQLKLKTIQEHFAQECAISRAGDDDLLPNLSPIIMSRKPLWEKNVAENVLKWGTGGINIDWCRVEMPDREEYEAKQRTFKSATGKVGEASWKNSSPLNDPETSIENSKLGRFPANFIHSGCDEVVELFPNTKSGGGKTIRKNTDAMFDMWIGYSSDGISDSGSASRFFYCAKASKSERNKGCEGLEEKSYTMNSSPKRQVIDGVQQDVDFTTKPLSNKNNHPTVKPVQLMEYLVKLVSREDAVVLDPFTWSWSTLIACKKLKRQYIWFELDEDYITIAEARLQSIKSESFTFFKDYPWNKR